MNKLLTFAALSALPLLASCVSTAEVGRNSSANPPLAAIAACSTPELEQRYSRLLESIAAIEREVELKAGLPMGILIHDEHGRLDALYQESKAIDRELSHRAAADFAKAEMLKVRL